MTWVERAIVNPRYRTPEPANLSAGLCLLKKPGRLAAERYVREALVGRPNLAPEWLPMDKLSLGAGETLAARGYVVFYCNPRGGTGYAEKHLNAIVGRWGTHDYDDVMTFTDVALRKARHLDRRRLAVGGGSYGGYMTNWIIGHTDRFACAVTSRSISNLLSFVGSSDFGYAWPQEFNCGQAWEDVAYYLKYSPLTYLKHMKTPTLIEHQEEDHRCPMEQAEQLWTALKWKGVPCEFLRYPNEPHGMSRGGRPDRRIHRMEKIVAWLDRWTKR